MRLLLLTPPFTQINTPYPATAQLTGYLKTLGHEVHQKDLGLAVALRLFSRSSLQEISALASRNLPSVDEVAQETVGFFLEAAADYESCIEDVIKFLQGLDDAVALRIVARNWLPEGPRFMPLRKHPEILEKFGLLGVRDQAKYLASLFLDDVADVIRLTVDEHFALSRYGEQLAASQSSFTPLFDRLTKQPHTLIDRLIDEQVKDDFRSIQPEVVGLSCPFPGNMYGGLRAAKSFSALSPAIKIVMGGGFVNTELRDLEDERFFEFIHYLIFDDGEKPMALLLERLQKGSGPLLRTKMKTPRGVEMVTSASSEIAFKDLPGPDYEGLPFDQYVSMMELPNPMHRMWSDFRWNKLILAHGCYWRKCTFCDTSLDYIQRYEPARIDRLVLHMKDLKQKTGMSGFHFVDEAAPPALLKALSQKLIEQKLNFTWWGNLRFDRQFTPELARLMADAGCVAVTGGLEVASPRLLNLINKGVSVEQVARVTKALSEAGILVHAYLMYGFPSQTAQETIDSLEVVRQLFAAGCLQSAHWHRFVATWHSPVGKNPSQFGIELKPASRPAHGWFARNAVDFSDQVKTDHTRLGEGLHRALYNYMHGVGLNQDVREWFEGPVPKAQVPRRFVRQALSLG